MWADVVGAMCGSIIYRVVRFFLFFLFLFFLFFFNDEEEPSQDKATSCISFY